MQYRINRRTGDKISEIGMGSAYLYEADKNEAIQALQTAYEGGINYYDLAAGHGKAGQATFLYAIVSVTPLVKVWGISQKVCEA